MNQRITIVCISCGLEHEETDDWSWSAGDYLQWHCPDCEEETEHRVEKVEEAER